VIKSRHDDPLPVDDSGGGMQQHHRVQTSGDREKQSSVISERRPYRRSRIRSFINERFHDTLNLYNTASGKRMETHGPLGTLWVSLGLIGFYLALIWLNTLLGVFLTPLFLIPGTWLMDKLQSRKRDAKSGTRADRAVVKVDGRKAQ